LDTINELEKYLVLNGYSFTELSIGSHYAPEGIVIEEENGVYNFSYSERGKKTIIKSFNEEHELVQYAFAQLTNDIWNKAHLVAATFDKAEIIEAEHQLNKMHIAFQRNDIPNYKVGCTKYRIFIFGTDINFLDEFKQRFLHY